MKKRKPAGGKKARIDKEAQELQLGTMIRERREALGMSQMELCEGIYSIPNLSRIENNEQLPIRSKLRKLAQRLGVPARRFLAVLDHEDLATRALHDEIINKMIQCGRTKNDERSDIFLQIREKLTELASVADPTDISTQQFILSREALLGNLEGRYSLEETLALQLEAMRLTHPDFDLEDIRRNYYTRDESTLINQMANIYSSLGQRKRAIDIYSQLLRYVERNDQALPDYSGHFCLISQNYAINLVKETRYAEAIEVAEHGEQVAQIKGDYQFLPGLVAIQAECYFFQGDLKKSKELYLLAYAGAKLDGDKNKQASIAREIKEHFGIDITIQM